jgi:hypothetical protein
MGLLSFPFETTAHKQLQVNVYAVGVVGWMNTRFSRVTFRLYAQMQQCNHYQCSDLVMKNNHKHRLNPCFSALL